ncbi:hypothetical protein [Arthrobacter oryzae]|uniref:hypothetical protein n=1 Tax=Arthrobacter oryzae TaxID=409290 RepID=UPI00273B1EE5|nr:hypothetical protein [Arthrobacter oryzae]WLQ07723.1 hypothetical protein Q8Z05_06125 [Arthrobacter oryzae]
MMSVIGPRVAAELWVPAVSRAGLEGAAVPGSAARCPGAGLGTAQEAAAIRTTPAKTVLTALFIDSPKSWTAPRTKQAYAAVPANQVVRLTAS